MIVNECDTDILSWRRKKHASLQLKTLTLAMRMARVSTVKKTPHFIFPVIVKFYVFLVYLFWSCIFILI